VVVVGGAARSPGAALLAGRAALRVGAGRLTLAVGESVAATIAAALPECGTVSLAQTSSGAVRAASLAAASADLRSADAVLIGPGLDDIAETKRMLRRLFALVDPGATVLLDAYALGAIAGKKHLGPARRILTPNIDEAHLLLGRREDDIAGAVMAIARRYRATVTCQGWVADPGGRLLRVEGGGPGLATSGSGDALAGAIAGLAARGCTPLQAAAWGTYLHTSAGETLARTVAPLGFLASEIVDRLPRELETIEASAD
jgi:hydroxyethylthiazole kinase-like uncharacterized protein yjeF